MPPRRAPSQASAAPSRPASPDVDFDDSPTFDTVDELQQHGINVQDILKLKSAAINTVSGVNMTTRRQLLKIKGMSEAKVEKIKEAAHKILVCDLRLNNYPFQSKIIFFRARRSQPVSKYKIRESES
ncbi:hypothetical protein BT96DRAFT_643069 [Gymnopus androsaceus JB14]|uniref:DNA recombination and repair protein Rad51-like C-terminal domain-containing protein n=1 Tax=Gymnopus androsaceus JB14 TaxID=1447944 RepID=A0A6A4HR44_9AGAR|nr:hypothetical protein BT96DRAFT_643069 [Gymnopus androsaceus JB14]